MENIITKRYILRKIKMEDKDDVFFILNDSSVIENLNMELHKTLDDTEKLIQDYLDENLKGNKYPFAIIDKKTNEFLGVFLIKLDLYCEDAFEFTVYIKLKHWGEGIYSEVIEYMKEFAFLKINTGNFRGYIMEKNIASEKVLIKSKFVLEKIFELPKLGVIKSYLMTKEMYENN